MTVTDLPALNATLNGVAAVLLLFGWIAIKRRGDRRAHPRWMVAALAVSSLFLVSYLYYHAHHGSTRYTGQGLGRAVYFFILATHIPLAALVVPASLLAVFWGWRGRFDRHVRLVRWLWPVWMYVSVTGVLIYLMLYVW
jgi:putative membrane protein